VLSKSSCEEKIIDQKERKVLLPLGIEPKSGAYHLQIRSIQGRGRPKPAFSHMDTDTVKKFQMRFIQRIKMRRVFCIYGLGQP